VTILLRRFSSYNAKQQNGVRVNFMFRFMLEDVKEAEVMCSWNLVWREIIKVPI